MLYTQKTNEEYSNFAEKVISHVEKAGYNNIRADFEGYDTPAALTMVNGDLTLTPDFTATKNNKKFYFELAIKNADSKVQQLLVSKWKALEMIAKLKGGLLQLFVPNGSFKFANELVKKFGIEARLVKLADI